MPAAGGNSIKLLAGSSHPTLAQAVADRLGIALTPVTAAKFSAGETNVQIHQSIREEDVYILQTSNVGSVNDNLMELLVLASAARTASARRLTVILPVYPYARFDRKDSGRAPITAKLVASLLKVAGVDHVVSYEIHASQVQGFFDIPVDNLSNITSTVSYIKEHIPGWRDSIIVSPDAGGAKRATAVSDRLGCEFALIHPKRKQNKPPRKDLHNAHLNLGSAAPSVPGTPMPNSAPALDSSQSIQSAMDGLSMSSSFHFSLPGSVNGHESLSSVDGEEKPDSLELLVGSVTGKTAILVDDMIDSGHTLKLATKVLKENGAKEIYAIITHGLFSDVTMANLKDLPLKRLIVTNSVDNEAKVRESNGLIHTIDMSPLLAEAIRRIHNGESISALFGRQE